MKMALTVWENRISPVFDSAHRLCVVEAKNNRIINKDYESFDPGFPQRLVNRLTNMDVSVLICGAISQMPANIIEASGIKLIPFITGDVEKVIDAYVKKIPIIQTFLMPGCGRKRQRQAGRKRSLGFSCGREVTYMPRSDGTGPQGQGPGTGMGRGGCKSGGSLNRSAKDSGQRSGGGKGKGGGQGRGKGGGGQGRGKSGGGQGRGKSGR